MRIYLRLSDDTTRDCTPPFVGADHAMVVGACPECGITPFKVAGKGMHIAEHDEYHADGYCLACKARVGTIIAVVSTIFGLEEDERMLAGRCRVY